MRLLLSKTRHGIALETREGENLLARFAATFKSAEHFKKAEKALRLPAPWLMQCVDAFERCGTAEVETPGPVPFACFIRGRLSSERAEFPSFESALGASCTVAEPIISWNDRKQLAALDVDFHGEPYHGDVEILASFVRPEWFWRTHGGGLRCVFQAQGGLAADELAALAALTLARHCMGSFEIKTDTRHPGSPVDGRTCGPVRRPGQVVDTSALSSWTGKATVDPGAVESYCERAGLEPGKRYAHDRCPIAPEEHADREPVVVGERGIHCYACAATGRRRGSRRPGWVPWAFLVGGESWSPLATCVRHFTHWDHARHIVAEVVGVEGEIAELAYRAALKLSHPEEGERVDAVFTAGRGLIRCAGVWCSLDGSAVSKSTKEILRTLPAFDGPASVAWAENAVDLTERGYPPITPIWGVRIYSQFCDMPETDVTRVLCTGELRHPANEAYRPKYVPAAKRIPIDEAWGEIEQVFPGVWRELVELLIAAKGCVEGRTGMPPIIFLSGPSGAGKTKTPEIAAGICGDFCTSVQWIPDRDRLRAAVAGAKEAGTFCAFNECLKDASANQRKATEAIDFILNLTAESVSHKLYVGPVRLGTPPVLIFTDTDVGEEIESDQQLARRLTVATFDRAIDWVGTMSAWGLTSGNGLRLIKAGRFPSVCDAILSHVIDRFFRSPRPFRDIAKELGFPSLAEEGASIRGQKLAAFYDAWQLLPEAAGADGRRFGAGSRVFDPNGETLAAEAWRDFGDTDKDRLRFATGSNWVVDGEPVRPSIRVHGKKVGVRF